MQKLYDFFSGCIRFYLSFLIFIVTLFCFSGCTTVYNPATGRSEWLLFDSAQEVSLGQNLASGVVSSYPIVTHGTQYDRVNRIGNSLVSVCDRKDIKYKFFLVDDNEKNAFALPGGFIYMHRGLMDIARTDDEIASVLGHEIAHVVARHSMHNLQKAYGYNVLSALVFREDSAAEAERIAAFAFDMAMRGYSREQERQADRLGVRYLYKAGYDPYAMISLFKKMKADKNGSPEFLEFMSTHPFFDGRIDIVEDEINRIRQGSAVSPEIR